MLNNDSKQVLDTIKILTGADGNYKIIESEEIIEKLPRDMTKVELSSVIRDLKDRDYIKVKYFTPDEYCLVTVRRADEVQQSVDETAAVSAPANSEEFAAPVKRKNGVVKPVKRGMLFLAGFLGSMLGGGIVTAIAILLQIYLV